MSGILQYCRKGGNCPVSVPETPGQCHFCWLATFDHAYGGTAPRAPRIIRRAANFAKAFTKHAVFGKAEHV